MWTTFRNKQYIVVVICDMKIVMSIICQSCKEQRLRHCELPLDNLTRSDSSFTVKKSSCKNSNLTKGQEIVHVRKKIRTVSQTFSASEYIEFYSDINLESFEFSIKWDQIAFICNGFDILTLKKSMILFLIFFVPYPYSIQ